MKCAHADVLDKGQKNGDLPEPVMEILRSKKSFYGSHNKFYTLYNTAVDNIMKRNTHL